MTAIDPFAQRPLLGSILRSWGRVTDAQLLEALQRQADTGGLIGELVVALHGVSRLTLASALSEQWRQTPLSITQDALTPARARAHDGPTAAELLAAVRELGERVEALEATVRRLTTGDDDVRLRLTGS